MTITQVATIQAGIVEYNGYCEVPSATNQAQEPYRVYVNSKLYSVACNCKAGQANRDCGHRLAVDRYFDSRRHLPVVQPLNSCQLCGYPTKGQICGRCL